MNNNIGCYFFYPLLLFCVLHSFSSFNKPIRHVAIQPYTLKSWRRTSPPRRHHNMTTRRGQEGMNDGVRLCLSTQPVRQKTKCKTTSWQFYITNGMLWSWMQVADCCGQMHKMVVEEDKSLDCYLNVHSQLTTSWHVLCPCSMHKAVGVYFDLVLERVHHKRHLERERK